MPAQLTTIPLKLIQPHPKLAFRFRYDVAGLADSIRSAADENTPNGQLNPGRVVLRSDGEGYYVYVGVRRYHALKLLYETTKDERFGTYTAYIDTGMDELQMFVKAKRENDEERGERQGLSVLEEVFGVTRIRDAIGTEVLDKWLKRLVDVADKLTEEKIRKLFEVEVASGFRFKLPHLEHLCTIAEEKDFFLTAATAAGFGYRGDDTAGAWNDRNAAYTLAWFKKVFPGYEPDTPRKGASPNVSAKRDKPRGKNEVRLEVHEQDVIAAPCPRCGTIQMVETEGEVKATHIPLDPDGERRTEVMESVSRANCTCSSCNGQFFLFVRHIGGREYAVEPSASRKLREPRETVESVDLRFDYEKNAWQKIVGDKIVGVLPARAGAKKRRG